MKKRHRQKGRNRSEKKQAQFNKKKKHGVSRFFKPGPSASGLIGRIEKNQRGFAFIIPEDRSLPDAYLSPREAGHLMNGDRVQYRLHRRGDRANGEIIKVVERANRYVLGRYYQEKKSGVIETPEGEAFATLSPVKASNGDWVVAEIQIYPDERRMGDRKSTRLNSSHRL